MFFYCLVLNLHYKHLLKKIRLISAWPVAWEFFCVWCLILNIALEDFFICWSVCNYFCFHHSLKFVISWIHRLGWDSFYVSCKIHHHCVNRWRAISNALSLQKTRKGELKGFCKNASRNGRNTIQLSNTDKASFFLSCLIKKKKKNEPHSECCIFVLLLSNL